MQTPETMSAIQGSVRENLLSVAATLFAEKGYRATTLDDIAAELGLKKASLYHYINSKEELLWNVYQQMFDRIDQAVTVFVSLDLSADERLRRMIHAHISVVVAEQASLSVVFQEEPELPEDLRRRIHHRKRAYERLFERVITEGQREGIFRQGSVRLMVLGLLGMCNWMYKWYNRDKFDSDEVAAEFALILSCGINSNVSRQGVWPRFDNLEEAFTRSDQILRHVGTDLVRLEKELCMVRERLQDGLARPSTSPVGGTTNATDSE